MTDDDVKGTPEAEPKAEKPARGRKKAKGATKRKYTKRAERVEVDAASLPDAHVSIASTKSVGKDDLAALQAQIADLNAQLSDEKTKRTAAEAAALAAAEAQAMLQQREIREVPTGRTRTIKKCTGYEVKGYKEDGRDILKPIWSAVQVPTFFYLVDLPPCGGTDLKINGTPLYHGSTIELDEDTLRTVKDIVYRCWKHDADIHGSDENAYRPKQNNRVSARAYA